MSNYTIKTRSTDYTGYETISSKGDSLSFNEVDANFLGLFERIYDVLPVGTVLPYVGNSAPSGFLILDGTSIGDTSSLGDHKNASYIRLFYQLFNMCLANPSTALACHDASGNPIDFSTTSQTASTAWAAHYNISLPDMRDKTILGNGGSEATSLLKAGGALTHSQTVNPVGTISIDNAGAHTHTITGSNATAGGFTPTGTISIDSAGAHSHAVTTPPHLHTISITLVTCADGVNNNIWQGTPPQTNNATVTGTTDSQGAHTHTGAFTGSAVAAHTHTWTGSSASAGDHNHTGTVTITPINLSTSSVPSYLSLAYIIKYSYGA